MTEETTRPAITPLPDGSVRIHLGDGISLSAIIPFMKSLAKVYFPGVRAKDLVLDCNDPDPKVVIIRKSEGLP